MKKWYRSKTLWINILAICVVVAEYSLAQQIYSPELHALTLAIVNIILRTITSQAVVK